MINHGAMFVHNLQQTYKKSIFPADVACLWGTHDRDLWREWGNRDHLVVTGNPTYSPCDAPPDRVPGLPSEYALYLTPGGGFQNEVLDESATELARLMPVVVKTHPHTPNIASLLDRFIVHTTPDTLRSLLYHASLIISNVTSAFLPALHWGKPIFLHNYDTDAYQFDRFEERFRTVFNFKKDSAWSRELIENAIRPSEADYEVFAHLNDGENARRCVDVIRNSIERSKRPGMQKARRAEQVSPQTQTL